MDEIIQSKTVETKTDGTDNNMGVKMGISAKDKVCEMPTIPPPPTIAAVSVGGEFKIPPVPPKKTNKPHYVRNLLEEFEKCQQFPVEQLGVKQNALSQKKPLQITKKIKQNKNSPLSLKSKPRGGTVPVQTTMMTTMGLPNTLGSTATRNVFMEGGTASDIWRFNKISKEKQMGLRFVHTFSDNVDVYIVDLKSRNDDRLILKTVNFYRSLGLKISILTPAFLGAVESKEKPLDEAQFEVRALEGPQLARVNTDKLFAGFQFIMVDSISFEGFKFTREEISGILVSSGGSVVILNWVDLTQVDGGGLGRKRVGVGGVSETLVLSWRLGGNQSRFDAIRHEIGLETVHVDYVLKCIEMQKMLPLDNKYKLYKV